MSIKSDPVTLNITNTIKPGKLKEYRIWVKGISNAARKFEGYEGTQLILPHTEDEDVVHVMIRFRDAETLSAWEESEIRHQWLKQLPELIETGKIEKVEGVEFWFEAPDAPLLKPPKYRMALITLLAIYPLILFIPPLLSMLLPDSTPHPLSVLISCTCTVLVMTWIVMPAITRIFSFWLFSK